MTIGRHVSKLSGYSPALPTPFDDEGNIDSPAFEKLCDCQIQNGATALVVCGTTGEAPTLSPAEHRTLIRIAAGVCCGQVPVIAGAGSNSTDHAIELTQDAEARGADAILSVVPYYNRPTQIGLYEHFRAIAQSTALPIILYDVPSRTAWAQADVGVAMNTGTVAAREAGNMVDLDSNPTKLIETVEIGKQLLMTRGALTTFSIANDVAKYFAIIPAMFVAFYPQLHALDIMDLSTRSTPQSAILAAIIFNALIIIALIPLALKGVAYRPIGAGPLLRRNLLIYGVGGVIVPFIGIKAIHLAVTALHLA
jgi:hypothetical protein